MELCEVVDTEGRVVGGEELEAAGSLYSFGELGAGTRTRQANIDPDETEGDEDDGMEIS